MKKSAMTLPWRILQSSREAEIHSQSTNKHTVMSLDRGFRGGKERGTVESGTACLLKRPCSASAA